MQSKNITFQSPVSVFRQSTTLGVGDFSNARTFVMLGTGMVLYDQIPDQVSASYILNDLRNSYRRTPRLYRVGRGLEKGPEGWSDFLTQCLGAGTKTIAPFGIIADFSFPRQDETYGEYQEEIQACALVFKDTQVPLFVQVSLITPPDVVRAVSCMPGVDGIILSEYISWSMLPKEVRKVFFNRETSPFSKEGGGLAVGKYWTPIALEWLTQIRRAGVLCTVGVGGFLRGRDVEHLRTAGASFVYIGRGVKALRPWQVLSITREARKIMP